MLAQNKTTLWEIINTGMLCRAFEYHITKHRIAETCRHRNTLCYIWPLHMAEKSWVNMQEFWTTWKHACIKNGIHLDQQILDNTRHELCALGHYMSE